MKSKLICLGLLLFAIGVTSKGQWTQITSDTTGVFGVVKFINQTDGLILGNDGIVMKTTDKGESWIHLANELSADFIGLQFINDTMIYAYGSNKIFTSTDFGSSWYEKSTLPSKSRSAYFLDLEIGFALGNTDGLLRTADGGLTWDSVWEHSGQDVLFSSQTDIEFVNDSVGFACGFAYKEKQFTWGNILKTTDRGKTWAMIFESPSIYQITNPIKIQVVNDSSIIAIEEDFTLIKSNDFGETWSVLPINKPDTDTWLGMTVSSMYCLNRDTIFVSAETTLWIVKSGGHSKRKILRTTNGGQEWIVQYLDIPESQCYGTPLMGEINFINDTIGVTTGSNLILRTTNVGGNTHIKDTTIIGGVEDYSGDLDGIYVFPNPTSAGLNIELTNDDYQTLEILSMSGRKMGAYHLNQINNIDLFDYPAGIYILRFSGRKTCHHRIIKI